MVVLVTGSNGQLGQSLQFTAKNYPKINFVFCNSSQLNITSLKNVTEVFEQFKPNFCINAAAYTAVDKAESEPENVFLINVTGAKNIALVCNQFKTTLLHISTDFVFDGTALKPYNEEDKTNPNGVYGQTKLDGEKEIQSICENYFIIRTSWVYSQFGNNFLKTMLRLASERDTLKVVNDQIGTPTNALDLADVLIKIIVSLKSKIPFTTTNQILNYSNEGQCSWYEFAKKIFEFNNISVDLKSIPSYQFITPAKRPSYSVLDKSKIKKQFGIEIKNWEESLKTIDLSVITEKKP